MEQLDTAVDLLKETLNTLENSVSDLRKETHGIETFNEILKTKMLFDVLPERLVLQRPLKIRKMVKPMIEKDEKVLENMLNKYKKKRQILQQQSKLLDLKLETLKR